MGFLFQPAHMKKPSLKSLQQRKDRFIKRLGTYELDNTITDLDSFDPTKYNYIDPGEAAERLLVLLAVSFTAYNFDESEKVMNWLKKEDLWAAVSDNEKLFFRNADPSDEETQKLSWRFEGAYMLAWCLSKVSSPPRPESECSEQEVSEFLQNIPSIGGPTGEFFSGIGYGSKSEVLDEMLFYQTAQAYFRNLVKEDKEKTSSIHAKACHERRQVLSWLVNDTSESSWDFIVADKDNS